VTPKQIENRLRIWRSLQDNFLATHRASAPLAHDTVYRRAVKLMNSQAARAFDLTEEPDKVREAYGRGRFGPTTSRRSSNFPPSSTPAGRR
jgi:hypothetical protein